MQQLRRLPGIHPAFLLFLAVLLAAPLGRAWADEGPWTVSEATGGATIQTNGTGTQPLVVGTRIIPGSKVRTDGNGRVVLTRGRTSMTLSPNGLTEVPADSDQGARTTILQRLGTLLLKVDKRPEQHFEVKTPYLAAVVKGTTFTVNVNDAGSSVHVVEGAVEVGDFDSGQVAMVRPGQTAKVSSQPGGGLSVTGKGDQSSSRGPAKKDEGGQDEAKGDKKKSAQNGKSGPAAKLLASVDFFGGHSILATGVDIDRIIQFRPPGPCIALLRKFLRSDRGQTVKATA